MGTHPIFESDFDCLTDCRMANNEQSESDLKAQIEKIADSIKEQAAQNQPTEGNGDGKPIDAETIDKRLAEFKEKFQGQMPFQGARSVTKNKDWAFWNTQPVPKFEEEITDDNMGPIEPSRDNVRQEPYTLPNGFEWDTMDINKEEDLTELYTLLNENYVEDDDNMFRFDYSREFLLWALTPPGWRTDWHYAVSVTTKKMVGFISAIPAKINVKGAITDMVEINYLCVLKKLRSKRVAPTLIREITRRVNQKGIFQACYTAGVVIPRPVGVARYHHRNMNPKKLVAIQFTSLTKNQTMNRMIRLMKLPDKPSIPGLRQMERKDCTKAWTLLSEYLKKFNLAPVYSEDEFVHWFLPREGVIYSYVAENADGDITDFGSYYSLPSTVVNNKQYDKLNAAYCYYNVSSRLTALMKDMLTVAKQQDFDVFNALDSMDNSEFLKPLKFGEGDGSLNYYLYNWRCPELSKEELGLVLL